jgi:NAD(P)-dependent dehydrogenase (short-subunit alcohol dehydrogenase family)
MENEMVGRKMGRLKDQVVIVTGAASGIGRATCLALAEERVRLVVVDVNGARIDELIAELEQGKSGSVDAEGPLGLELSVRLEKDMEEMARQTLDRFGRIDILVHCAGILRGKDSGPRLLYEVSLKEWDAVVETNLKGTFLSNRSVLPSMIQQGKGHIINFSSTSGLRGRAFDSVYCATKFGVIGLSESLAEEVRRYGIKVHVVLPDAVDTPIWDQNGPVRAPKDSLQPERVADLVAYLALLPEDTVLGNLVILPFKLRRRKKGKSEG